MQVRRVNMELVLVGGRFEWGRGCGDIAVREMMEMMCGGSWEMMETSGPEKEGCMETLVMARVRQEFCATQQEGDAGDIL